MKINEVAMREAEPNYEVDPAEARLSAIARVCRIYWTL